MAGRKVRRTKLVVTTKVVVRRNFGCGAAYTKVDYARLRSPAPSSAKVDTGRDSLDHLFSRKDSEDYADRLGMIWFAISKNAYVPSDWEEEFMDSITYRVVSRKPLSDKQMGVIDRIYFKAANCDFSEYLAMPRHARLYEYLGTDDNGNV